MKIGCWKAFCVCFISFSMLFAAFPAFAENGTLQVKCADASGNPVPGVKVVAVQLKSQKAKDKKSDAQGIADFGKIEDGAYRIVGRKEGFVPALYEFAMVSGGPQTITLKFAPGADKKLHFEDPAEENRAFDLLRQGLESYKQNKFADAEKLFLQSVEISSSNPDAVYYLSVAYLQQSKFDQGIEMLKRTIELSSAYLTLPSPNPNGPNPYEQMSQNAQQLLKRMPALRGESALRQQKYDEAVVQFKEAVKSDPNNSEYHANLAIALTNAKQFDEALASLENALKLKPTEKAYTDLKAQINARKEGMVLDKAQTFMNEGNKLLQDGDAAGALKKYEESKALVAQDKQSPLWRQMARAHAKLNQEDAAVAAFKKSIELAPADKASEYRNSFAQYYLDGKKYDEAVEVLADPKAAGSQSPEQTLLALAASSKNKQPQLAEAALERLLKVNPDNSDAYFDLGQMYYADGKEKDSRTKELLTKYVETGKDEAKLESAKNMLIMINRRTK